MTKSIVRKQEKIEKMEIERKRLEFLAGYKMTSINTRNGKKETLNGSLGQKRSSK